MNVFPKFEMVFDTMARIILQHMTEGILGVDGTGSRVIPVIDRVDRPPLTDPNEANLLSYWDLDSTRWHMEGTNYPTLTYRLYYSGEFMPLYDESLVQQTYRKQHQLVKTVDPELPLLTFKSIDDDVSYDDDDLPYYEERWHFDLGYGMDYTLAAGLVERYFPTYVCEHAK